MPPPRHTSYEYSCVCGAGFTQAQHLTRHKTDCSTSKEIAQRAFEKGQKHKHKPPAKRKRTESTGGNASSSYRSLSVASSRSQMSVDAGEQDDVQMGLNEDNDFDFPEAPPPSSSPPFEFFDMASSPAPPEPAVEPSKRIRKPTAKRRMALEDALPEGPGPIDARPEPPRAVSPVRNILLRLPRLTQILLYPTW
ncbi:hypothetical protein PILCRDRAFT_12198 [Piloderma croceum F 1598]|uniref:Uncharacterized protein n=1 Tax=Piloderma croceum (strain F 1598) TaxID=765440 RepID=A0A0C3FBU8_PILCF|nr:hypothetical protein PILCRDRAFT_12198 [Piloderma croceum F 1598]